MHPFRRGAFFMPDEAINTGISRKGEEKNEKKIF